MPTYKLNPELKRITSLVHLILPDGNALHFKTGTEAADATFDTRYLLDTLCAEDSTVVITLREAEAMNLNWSGEEPVSFF